MPEQALYLAWRPMRFEDVIGQEHITRTLRNSLKSGRVRHAYLFSGPRGTGKTTTARLLAKAVNCRHAEPAQRPCNDCNACLAVNEGRYLDLIEIDAATHTGVDDVRDLRDKIAFAPGEGSYKVYIIDEVHRFTGNAFDALLKTLEEPPPHAVFVLATTEIDKVPATIKSRCLPFEFRRVPVAAVADHLQHIAAAEGLRVERPALELIARQGTGSVRDSISLLDQVVTDPEAEITLELTQDVLGTAAGDAVRALLDALVQRDAAAGLNVINQAVDAGSDPQQFGQQIVEQLRNLLLTLTAGAALVVATEEERERYRAQAGQISLGQVLHALRKFNAALSDETGGWQPQLALELALVESIAPAAAEADRPTSPLAEMTSTPSTATTPVSGATAARETARASAVAQREAKPAAVQVEKTQAPQAAAPAGVAPDAPAPEVGAELTLEHLQGRWEEVRQEIGKLRRSGIPALIEHARPGDLRDNMVMLDASSAFFRDRLNSGDTRAALEAALEAVFGRPLRVRVRLQAQGGSADAQIDESDPLIASAVALGARVSVKETGAEGD